MQKIMNIKNIWIFLMRRFKKSPFALIALLAVTTISIFLLYAAFDEWNKENYNIYMTKKLLGRESELYNISLLTMEWGSDVENSMEEFLQKLPDVQGVTHSGRQMSITSEWKEIADNSDIMEITKELRAGTIGEEYPQIMDIHCISRELLSTFGLEELEREDTTKYLPIMVGSGYRDVFNIGEIYTDSMTGCQFKVTGFLQDGFKLPSSSPLYSELYIDTEDGMVSIYDERVNPDNIMTLNARSSMYFISDGSDSVRERVYSLAEACGLYTKISTADEMISEYREENRESLGLTFLFTGIAVLAGFIAVVSSAIIRIFVHKQEYGIFYANGVSFADVFKLIAMDNGIKLLSAMIFAWFIMIIYIKRTTLTDVEECLHVFIVKTAPEVGLLVAILWFLSTTIPACILGRMHIVDLLRGNEI